MAGVRFSGVLVTSFLLTFLLTSSFAEAGVDAGDLGQDQDWALAHALGRRQLKSDLLALLEKLKEKKEPPAPPSPPPPAPPTPPPPKKEVIIEILKDIKKKKLP